MTDAGISAKSLDRPALSAALEALTTGKADVLIVSKLDRLSRSLPDFVDLMSRAKAEGWRLVSLDCNVDTESPTGGLILSVLACFAEFERRLIGQRTKDGLAAKRAMGVRLGRPTVLPAALLDRITALSKSGLSYVAIAKTLTDEKVPTARGGTTWNPSSVRRVVLRVNEA
jgi:DNA invertase Pin-like site-specific DNA recombinase